LDTDAAPKSTKLISTSVCRGL